MPDKIPFFDPFDPANHVQWTGRGWRLAIAEVKRRRAKRAKLYRLFGLEPPSDAK